MENQSRIEFSLTILNSSCKNNIVEPSPSQKKEKGGKKIYPVKGLIFLFISGLRFRFSFSLFSLESRDSFQPIPHILYIYTTFRSNFSNRIVFDRKKKKKESLIDPPTMLTHTHTHTQKEKKRYKSTIAKNLLSRYFSILSNNSLSLSVVHSFARNIYRAVSPVPRATKS